eukprot:1349836-Pleurochrysis_carterae.AAC.13
MELDVEGAKVELAEHGQTRLISAGESAKGTNIMWQYTVAASCEVQNPSKSMSESVELAIQNHAVRI